MYSITNITKVYRGVHALDNVSMRLEPGKIYGLLGPNGSGKTTLLRIMAGLLQADGGELSLGGGISAKSRAEIVYVTDMPQFPWPMTGEQAAEFTRGSFPGFDMGRFNEVAKRLNFDLRRKKLSRGESMKLHIALALGRKGRIYLFDEPTANLDMNTREGIMSIIMEYATENAAVMLSTHLVQEVEAALDEAIFLSEGRVVAQANAENLRENNGKSITQYYREIYLGVQA